MKIHNFIILMTVFGFFVIGLFINPIYAQLQNLEGIDVDFDYENYIYDYGHIAGITVKDVSANLDANAIDTVTVHLSSIQDPIGFDLILDESDVDTGIFNNAQLAFMTHDYVFPLDYVIIYQVIAPGYAGNGTLAITVTSDTTPSGINLQLIETGPSTGIFENMITLSSAFTDESSTTIQVSSGDFFKLSGPYELVTNGMISPNPDGANGIILTEMGDTFTVTYGSFNDTARIWAPGGGGGSGNGGVIIRPGLVLDAIAALFGSSTAIPPTLGLDQQHKRIVDDGFSFNGNPIDVEQYYTPYPLITTEVGKLNTVKLKIYENRGPDNISHVGLSYGLGKGEIFNEGKATIEYDRKFDGTESVTLFDPKNVLGVVNVTSAETNCSTHNNAKCLEVTFDHIFRAPLEFNMVATNIWDFQRNGWQNYFNHGIHITGESMNPPEQYSGIYQGHIYHLVETGKNTAVDEEGNTWTFDKTWSRDYKKQVPADTDILNQDKISAIEKLGLGYAEAQEIFGFDRVDHRFENTKHSQQLQAQEIMKSLCPECQDKPFDDIDKIFSYDVSNRHSKLDSALLQMEIEDKKAREFLKQYFDSIYPGIKYR